MENRMVGSIVSIASSRAVFGVVLLAVVGVGWAQEAKAPYPAMAPIEQYHVASVAEEVALARSAAPGSISDGAEVMVLGREGYKTAVKGTNGFLCIVERSWGQSTDQTEFWNPKMRDMLIELQNKEAEEAVRGSWDKDQGFIGSSCGKLGTTALALLTLEVYYRYLPLYRTADTEGLEAQPAAGQDKKKDLEAEPAAGPDKKKK